MVILSYCETVAFRCMAACPLREMGAFARPRNHAAAALAHIHYIIISSNGAKVKPERNNFSPRGFSARGVGGETDKQSLIHRAVAGDGKGFLISDLNRFFVGKVAECFFTSRGTLQKDRLAYTLECRRLLANFQI